VSADVAVAIEIFSDPGDYYRRNMTIDDVPTYISDRKKSTPKLPQRRKGFVNNMTIGQVDDGAVVRRVPAGNI
jgi:hypothetical protein